MNVSESENKHSRIIVLSGAFTTMPAFLIFHPGGTPSVGDGEFDRKVDTAPFAPVLVTVAASVVGAIVGSAVAFMAPLTSIGLYVLVASAENTILPTEAGTDVFNAYAGVV
jgi:hypothetical protein